MGNARRNLITLAVSAALLALAPAAGATDVQRVAPALGATTVSAPNYLTAMGGFVYFSANMSGAGTELWRTDGTAEGTTLVKDILDPGSSAPKDLTRVGDKIYFTAVTPGSAKYQLWVTDGTTDGTKLVKQIRSDNLDPMIGNGLTNIVDGSAVSPGTVFFRAIGDEDGSVRGLWASDGSEGGTHEVIGPNGPAGGVTGLSNPDSMLAHNGLLYMAANFQDLNREPVVTDGTNDSPATGPKLLKDIDECPDINGGASSPVYFTPLGTKVLFSARTIHDLGSNCADYSDIGAELWITDGTPGGTQLLKNINTVADTPSIEEGSFPQNLTNIGDTVYFSASTADGRELWQTDGTPGGTSERADLNPGPGSSFPDNFIKFGDQIFFTATDSSGQHLWRMPEAGGAPQPVMVINPTVSQQNVSMAVAGGRLLFAADDGVRGHELWALDSAAGTPHLVQNINLCSESSPGRFTVLGSELLFVARADATDELWKTTSGADPSINPCQPLTGDPSSGGSGSGGSGGNAGGADNDPPVFAKPVAVVGRTKGRGKKASATVNISFSATDAGTVRFICFLNNAASKRCSSPYKLKLRPGRYTLLISGTDSAGNNAAVTLRFKVKK